MLNSYVILADATADILPEYAQRMGIDVIPMEVNMDETTFYHYPDEREMKIETFYDIISTGKVAKTTQVSQNEFIQYFERYLIEGKDILYIAFSSGLSGTYQSSRIAANELAEKYPERKIICFDSLCASAGEFLLIYHSYQKQQQGYSLEENAKWLQENQLSLCHWFTVDDLNVLKRGGRISATTAVIGTALQIKPVLHVDNEGHLIHVGKVRGRKASLKAIAEDFHRRFLPDKNNLIIIAHGGCLEDAQYLQQLIQADAKGCEIIIAKIGPVIGAHTGKGVVALFYLGSER